MVLLVGWAGAVTACGGYYEKSDGSGGSGGGPAATTGTLSIASDGADIFVGGAYLGRGGVSTTLIPGSYTVVARRPSNGWICWQRSIAVRAGGGSRINDNTFCR